MIASKSKFSLSGRWYKSLIDGQNSFIWKELLIIISFDVSLSQ